MWIAVLLCTLAAALRGAEAADPVSPAVFHVQFTTNVVADPATGIEAEPIVIEVTRKWAPLGADRFFALINDHYYDKAAFFRVVPDFVVQFGIAALPEETAKWDTPIPDDPVLMSNTYGMVTYATAGPDTRTTQLFINYANNTSLDSQGFAPFAKVISGMVTAERIVNPTPGSSNGISQPAYTKGGNAWLLPKYPTPSNVNLIDVGIFEN